MNFNQLIANNSSVISVIEMDGLSKSELLKKLDDSKIALNDYARIIFDSSEFDTAQNCSVTIIECSLLDIGLPSGGNFESIRNAIELVNLSYCPVSLAPYVRLKYKDQSPSNIQTVHQHPHGSITIFSKPLSDDDDFPKGFYLRNYDGKLWLRGYTCSNDYYWQPNDRMIFQISGR